MIRLARSGRGLSFFFFRFTNAPCVLKRIALRHLLLRSDQDMHYSHMEQIKLPECAN